MSECRANVWPASTDTSSVRRRRPAARLADHRQPPRQASSTCRRRGHRDVEAAAPVEADTIWRIYSMTKPITAVLALQLWEEGAFELKDPVAKYIPAFANTKVWRSGSSTSPVLDPSVEPMRLWQLFAHTSGLTYGFMFAHPVDELYRRAGFEWGMPRDTDLERIVRQLGRAAAAVPARHRVELLDRPRRARPRARGHQRPAVRRVCCEPACSSRLA